MTVLSRCLACFLLLLLGLRMDAAEASKEEALLVAQQVHDLFDAKCVSCHGPELPRPKGKFGYVLDLQRMADNPDYIIRGQPEKSELYKMVYNDDMPGENSDVTPLSKQEKEIVRRWVEIGAPGTLPNTPTTSSTASSGSGAASLQSHDPFLKRFFRWVGQFHPASTHFPVALMFVAVFAETLAWYTKSPSWLHTVRFIVILAALGAIGATVLGWLNANFSSYNKETFALLWWHRWIGTGSTVWALVSAGLLLLGDTSEGSRSRRAFRGALIAGAGLVGVAGFLGAGLIYGLDHYAWH